MTKKEKTRPLSIGVMIMLAFGILIAFALYFLTSTLATYMIDTIYMSEENRERREEQYVRELQEYITARGLTGEDTADFARWARNNRYLYLMIYKDEQLFFDSGSYEEPTIPDEDEPTDDTPSEGGDGEEPDTPDNEGADDTGGATTPDEGGEVPDEGAEGTDPDTDGEGSLGEEPDGSGGQTTPGTGSGITVRFPTREELMKYAEENDAHILKTADEGVLVVNMADFTEYLYYDMINIISMALAVIALFSIIMAHYHGVTKRITKLARDVSIVAEGDMEHPILSEGRDEISELSLNVEDMRSAILLNIEKEREAMEANRELITSMSHDIRTPLTVLLGYIDIMKERAEGDETMKEYVQASEKTALRLKKLSDDLFNYFLLFGSGAEDVTISEYDIGTLFDQMLSEHVFLLKENGYDVRLEMPSELTGRRIATDPAQLMRILENIFSNLVKYADKNAPVLINGEVLDGKFKLKFTNKIAKVEHAESNGIGLKSVRKIAEGLGAMVECGDDGESFSILLSFNIWRA